MYCLKGVRHNLMSNILKVSIIITALFLIGCKNNNDPISAPTDDRNENLIHVKNVDQAESEQLTNSEIATHLSNIATQIKDVNDAASIVVGPYAVVGIDIDKNLDRQRVGTIKYTVTEALRNDPYGKTAVVIADADLMERFRNMGVEIQNGRPIRGIVEELAEIVNRYIPDVPVEENRYNNQNENNNLQKRDENKLKEIQKEQSEDKE